jgi:acylphosphatase
MSESSDDKRRVELRIHGRVQGVGFRFSAVDEARRLGVKGWVRNASDGAVELVAEGDRAQLQRLAAWCRQGPRGAAVNDVEEQWLAACGEFDSFHIRH